MGKIQLIWPTVAEELKTSAERRRLQRDREQRSKLRMAGPNGANTPDENSKPTELAGKGKAPKLKQQTLSRFFGVMTKSDAPTPAQPSEQRLQNDVKHKRRSPNSSSNSDSSSIIAIPSTPLSDCEHSPFAAPSSHSSETAVPTKNQAIKLDSAEASRAKADNEQRRVHRFVNRLKKSLNELDRESLAKDLAFTAVRLDNGGVDQIPSPFLRYLVKIELAKKERENKIRTIPMAERKEFRRTFDETKMPKANPHFDQLLASFKSGKYEDTVVLESEQCAKFIELCPVLADQKLTHYFGRALALTQFIHSHGHFLSGKNKNKSNNISAANLLISMATSDPVGYSANVLPLLRLLTTFLNGQNKFKLTTRREEPEEADLPWAVRSLRSRSIRKSVGPTTEQTEENLLEVVKKLLLTDDALSIAGTDGQHQTADPGKDDAAAGTKQKSTRPVSNGSSCDGVEDAKVTAAQRDKFCDVRFQLDDMNISYFYQLSTHAQMTILEHLVDQILSTDSFNAHVKECMEQLYEARQRKAALERELSEQHAQLALLEKEIAVQNEKLGAHFSSLSRKQTSENSANLKKLCTLQRNVNYIEQKLHKTERQCRILLINNKCRIEPLGQDRFHRFYWFFAGSADDYAVFVQQQQQRCCSSYSVDENNHFQCTSKSDGSKRQIENENVAAVDGNEDELFMRRLIENVEGRPPCAVGSNCSTTASAEQWWSIQSSAQLDNLIDTLTSRGLREHRLKRQLIAYRDLIEEGMDKAKAKDDDDGCVSDSKENMEIEE